MICYPGPRRLFVDPALTLMLDLFVAEAIGRSVSVTSASVVMRVPLTSSLYLMKTLGEHELIERRADVHDGRRSFVLLTDKGRKAIGAYLAVA